MNRETTRGFTLLELVVTIAVAGIIISFGVPGFMSMIQNNRATTHTNDLVTALNLARSEATRRATSITVCSSTDGTTCGGTGDWTTGWVVRSDTDLIRTWPARSGARDASIVTGDSVVQFLPRGSVPGGAAIEVRLPDCSGNQVRTVSVGVTGRISVDRTTC